MPPFADRRNRRPLVERLEGRDLPTVLPGWGLPAHPLHVAVAATAPSTPLVNPGGIPSPHEQARQLFHARFQGPLKIGPGRTSATSSMVYIRAGGTSNAFLRGSVLIGLAVPVDPTAQVTGVAAIFPSNASATGNDLVLDLVAPRPADGSPPTQLAWTVDVASAGLWADATGSGTLTLRSTSHRHAGAIFQGSITTTGLTNILNAAHI